MRELIPLLNVEDAPRSIRFYSEVLGFSVENEFELEGVVVWARLSKGPVHLMINRSPGRVARGKRERPKSYDDVLLCLRVDDIHEVRGALVASGAEPGDIAAEDYGFYEFTVRDPDGYELAFQQPR